MSEAPERIWVWRNEPGNEVVISVPGQPYPAGSPEYICADIAQAQIDAAVKAERERADKAEADLRVSVGGCDANAGWSHKPILIDGGKYFFCQNCGETLTKTVAKRHSTAAAIRKGEQP
jgi:hypothetical protein